MEEKEVNEIQEGKKVFVGEFDENEINDNNVNDDVIIEDNITEEVVNDPVNKTKKKRKKKPMDKKTKIIIIASIIIGMVILGIILFFVLRPKEDIKETTTKTKIDTGYDWADKYAKYINKNIIDNYEEIEGTFINFDGKDDSEMVVNYEKSNKEYTIILYIDEEGDVIESDKYIDADVAILYSIETSEKDWYLETNNNNTYIPVAQLINPSAKNIDIESSSITKDDNFGDSYIEAEIDVEFYDITKKNLSKDIKQMVKNIQEDFVSDSEETSILNTIKIKIEEEKKKQEEEEQKKKEEEEASKKLTVNGHTLTYGKYAWYAKEDGVDSDYHNIVVIKKDGTCTYDFESTVGTCTYKVENYDWSQDSSATHIEPSLCLYTDKGGKNCFSVNGDNKLSEEMYTLTYRAG